ncbi:hypothetical protein D5S17_35925 [Pseudonocardiaceae bacterium YIM PH 21723]|nr:hypothetical protein D5S17_35925 [Pseudonocardiaceae bacterium YIM PH 21723]
MRRTDVGGVDPSHTNAVVRLGWQDTENWRIWVDTINDYEGGWLLDASVPTVSQMDAYWAVSRQDWAPLQEVLPSMRFAVDMLDPSISVYGIDTTTEVLLAIDRHGDEQGPCMWTIPVGTHRPDEKQSPPQNLWSFTGIRQPNRITATQANYIGATFWALAVRHPLTEAHREFVQSAIDKIYPLENYVPLNDLETQAYDILRRAHWLPMQVQRMTSLWQIRDLKDAEALATHSGGYWLEKLGWPAGTGIRDEQPGPIFTGQDALRLHEAKWTPDEVAGHIAATQSRSAQVRPSTP